MIVGIELLEYYGSLEGLMGTRTERNQDKGYVGVRELS